MRRRSRRSRALVNRRHRNPGGGAVLAAVMPYVVMAGAAVAGYFALKSAFPSFFNTAPQEAGGNDTSAATTLGALASNPSAEVGVLGQDVSDSVTGIEGLAGDAVTSLENGVSSLWNSAKAAL